MALCAIDSSELLVINFQINDGKDGLCEIFLARSKFIAIPNMDEWVSTINCMGPIAKILSITRLTTYDCDQDLSNSYGWGLYMSFSLQRDCYLLTICLPRKVKSLSNFSVSPTQKHFPIMASTTHRPPRHDISTDALIRRVAARHVATIQELRRSNRLR